MNSTKKHMKEQMPMPEHTDKNIEKIGKISDDVFKKGGYDDERTLENIKDVAAVLIASEKLGINNVAVINGAGHNSWVSIEDKNLASDEYEKIKNKLLEIADVLNKNEVEVRTNEIIEQLENHGYSVIGGPLTEATIRDEEESKKILEENILKQEQQREGMELTQEEINLLEEKYRTIMERGDLMNELSSIMEVANLYGKHGDTKLLKAFLLKYPTAEDFDTLYTPWEFGYPEDSMEDEVIYTEGWDRVKQLKNILYTKDK